MRLQILHDAIIAPDRLLQERYRRLQAIVGDRNALQKQVWRTEIVILLADGHGTVTAPGVGDGLVRSRPPGVHFRRRRAAGFQVFEQTFQEEGRQLLLARLSE